MKIFLPFSMFANRSVSVNKHENALFSNCWCRILITDIHCYNTSLLLSFILWSITVSCLPSKFSIGFRLPNHVEYNLWWTVVSGGLILFGSSSKTNGVLTNNSLLPFCVSHYVSLPWKLTKQRDTCFPTRLTANTGVHWWRSIQFPKMQWK